MLRGIRVAPRIPTLETERLRLRGWVEADVAPYGRILGDPEVMRYMGAGAAFSVKTKAARRFGVVARIDARRRMARFSEHWRAHGFGVWAVEEAAGDALVGEVGLRRTPDFPGGGPAVEIGWLLARQAWGKGYATEAARAVLSYAFEQAGVDRVVSIARVENVRSERVMTRLGLSRHRDSALARPDGRLVRNRPIEPERRLVRTRSG